MPYAVQLYLDSRTESAVRTMWEAVAACGVSSFLPDAGGRPHVTLAVSDTLDVTGLSDALQAIADARPAFRVVFSSVGVFPAQDTVVFLGAVVSRALLDLHDQVHEAVGAHTGTAWGHYLPERWVPLCTLAQRILPQQAPVALEACRPPLPMFARAEEIGLVEFYPMRVLRTFGLPATLL